MGLAAARNNRNQGRSLWSQDQEQDLQLGALFSALAPVAINAIAGAINKGQQQDFGFSAGGGFTTPWGGAGGSLGWNQDQDFRSYKGCSPNGLICTSGSWSRSAQ